MTGDLSQDQQTLRAGITRNGLIWGGIAGVLAGLVVFWLSGALEGMLRIPLALIVGAGVGYLAYRGITRSGADKARCAKCGAAFTVTQTGREEALASRTPKSTVELGPDVDKAAYKRGERQMQTVTEWVEETYDVTLTRTCAQCGDVTTQTYKQTREKDRTSREEPADPA